MGSAAHRPLVPTVGMTALDCSCLIPFLSSWVRFFTITGRSSCIKNSASQRKTHEAIDGLCARSPDGGRVKRLAAIRPRYNSISSSILHNELHSRLMLAVVDAPARSSHGRYLDICSNVPRRVQVPLGGLVIADLL